MAKHPGGRPRMQLDERQIKELAHIQCTMAEIAAVMGCCKDVLEDRYSAIIKEAREGGKESLRRAQWNKAIKEGNCTMQIWLGKHYLDQKDSIQIGSSQEPEVRKLINKIERMGRETPGKEIAA